MLITISETIEITPQEEKLLRLIKTKGTVQFDVYALQDEQQRAFYDLQTKDLIDLKLRETVFVLTDKGRRIVDELIKRESFLIKK